MSKLIQNQKALKEMKGANVAEILLLALAMDSRKGELYQDVANEMHKTWPFEIVLGENGKYNFKYPDNFPSVVGYLAMQFTCWPQHEEIIEGGKKMTNDGFTSVGTKKKEGKLSKEQIAAYDAINRFNSWYTGYKLTAIREAVDADFQAEVKEKENELIAALPKNDRKDEEKVKAEKKKALEAVRAAHKKAPNPKVFDMDGNINTKQLKNLEDTKKAGIVLEIAKDKPETIIAALREAGRPVVEAKSIDELHASYLLKQLEKHLRTGEFTNPIEAKKHLDSLNKLLAVNGAKELGKDKGAGKKKVANA